jgi:hypothetical protein
MHHQGTLSRSSTGGSSTFLCGFAALQVNIPLLTSSMQEDKFEMVGYIDMYQILTLTVFLHISWPQGMNRPTKRALYNSSESMPQGPH